MAKKTNSDIFSSVLYIIIGVLLFVFPGDMLKVGMAIAGVIFVISGILEILKKNWAGGAISLIIGIAIFVIGLTVTWIVLLVLGILLAVKGLVALIDALRRSPKTVLGILFPILTIIIGGFLAFGDALPVIVKVGGVLLALDGLLGLIGSVIRKN